MNRLRNRVHMALDPRARLTDGLSVLDWGLIAFILVAVVGAIAETEPTVLNGNEQLFTVVNLGFGLIFSVEYALRLWSSAERDPTRPGKARLAFIFSPAAMIDLAAIVSTLDPVLGFNAVPLRIARALRIIRIARLGRLSQAMQHLQIAIASRAYELGLALGLVIVVLLFGATALYWLEGSVQPAKFGSIPRAMWWAVETLTTVGYGDVYPITPAGKLVAAALAILGVGVIALPVGILASAFSDAVQRQKLDAGTKLDG